MTLGRPKQKAKRKKKRNEKWKVKRKKTDETKSKKIKKMEETMKDERAKARTKATVRYLAQANHAWMSPGLLELEVVVMASKNPGTWEGLDHHCQFFPR